MEGKICLRRHEYFADQDGEWIDDYAATRRKQSAAVRPNQPDQRSERDIPGLSGADLFRWTAGRRSMDRNCAVQRQIRAQTLEGRGRSGEGTRPRRDGLHYVLPVGAVHEGWAYAGYGCV